MIKSLLLHFSYFSSFQIGNSIPIPIEGVGVGTLSLGYHSTLNKTNEKIKNEHKAVGTSTSWWGMYALHLASTFLLKFGPMFNKTLAQLSADPQTDSDQQMYNLLISTFGTHYVSSVIVGGVVHVYTFVSNAYAKEASTEQFSQQCHKIIPPVFIGDGEESVNSSDWKKWMKNASNQPSVINRTISNITDLLIDYPPEIRKHLQLTINYYLKNGVLPTLEQINTYQNQQRNKRQLSNDEELIPPIPGLDVVGCGFDITSLETKVCLLNAENSSDTWTDPLNLLASFFVPDGFFVVDIPNLLTKYGLKVFTNLTEFFSDSIYRTESTWSSSFRGIGANTRSTEVRTRIQNFYEYNFYLAWIYRQIIWYTLAVPSFPPPKLNPIAQRAFDQLPTTYDATNVDVWKQFFDAYGTHYVVSADMGGMAWAEDWIQKCLFERRTETWIKEQTSRSFFGFFSSYSSATSDGHTLNVDKEYKELTWSTFKLVGGIETPDLRRFDKWLASIKYHPRPVNYRLMPIHTLLPNGAQRDALETASILFRSEMVNESNAHIVNMESIQQSANSNPAIKCQPFTAKNRKRRDLSVQDLSDKDELSTDVHWLNESGENETYTEPYIQFDTTEARSIFCPMIGFHGPYCPGDTSESNNSYVNVTNKSYRVRRQDDLEYVKLPKAVGLAFDVTVGKLLLPAIEFNYSDSTRLWSDDSSGQSFIIPAGVKITNAAPDDSSVKIRIYKNENDLLQVWLRNEESGQWWGGEFAHVQNISEIYDTFYKDNRAMAISQKLYVLYSLTVDGADNPATIKLNDYAKNAIDALTLKYDQRLYDEFMNAWGTHVAVETKVGGMKEQQVIYKECMLKTSDFVDGISEAQLEKNLQQELLSPLRPCLDDYYYFRRRTYVNHFIGGDLTKINNTQLWQKTILKDPVVLTVSRYVPWSDIVENQTISKNLKRAIKYRLDTINAARTEQANQVQVQRLNATIPAKYVIYKAVYKPPDTTTPMPLTEYTKDPTMTEETTSPPFEYIYEVGVDNVTLASAYICPSVEETLPYCNVGRNISSCPLAVIKNNWTMTNQVQLLYERSQTTGSFRTVARRIYGNITIAGTHTFQNYDVQGPWTQAGCSKIVNPCFDTAAGRWNPIRNVSAETKKIDIQHLNRHS
ncbi:unnamed protein product, partial [Didymodactylos carnosus]